MTADQSGRTPLPDPIPSDERVLTPEGCDSCGSEGFRLTLSPDGEAQVCDGCLAGLTGRTPVLAWLRWVLIAVGYWIKPYWHGVDRRVWRWQRKPCRYVVLKGDQ